MNDPAQHPRSSASSTPDALLAAARAVFARKGYDGATIRAITDDAGANLGAVTYHFGSKRALYEGVLQSVLEPLHHRIRSAARIEGPPLDQIETVIRAFFAHLRENPDMPQLILQELAAGKTPPPAVVRTMRSAIGTLAMIVGEGQSDLTIRPGDPLMMALSVMYQPIHFTLIRRLGQEIMGLDQDEPKVFGRVVDHAVEFARRGLAGDPEAFL